MYLNDSESHLSGDSTRCKEKKKAAGSRRRCIAQFAVAFGVTWIFLNAITGSHPSTLIDIRDVSLRISDWKSSPTMRYGHRNKPLRPLSDRAISIRDRCEALPPFPEDVYRTRISHVHEELRKIAEERELKHDESQSSAGELYIMEPGASSMYYTGINGQDWHISERPFLLLIEHSIEKAQKSVPLLTILTPAFEASRAKLLDLPGMNKDTEVHFLEWKEEEDWAQVLMRHLDRRNGSIAQGTASFHIHFDPAVRTFIPAGIARAVASTRDSDNKLKLAIDVADPRILSVRERKSAEELAVLKCGNEVSDRSSTGKRKAVLLTGCCATS